MSATHTARPRRSSYGNCSAFCDIDDFGQQFEPAWQQRLTAEDSVQPLRARRLCVSEGLTNVGSFQQSGYRPLKEYFLRYVSPICPGPLPHLVSYTRLVELMSAAWSRSAPLGRRGKARAQALRLLIPLCWRSAIPSARPARTSLPALPPGA